MRDMTDKWVKYEQGVGGAIVVILDPLRGEAVFWKKGSTELKYVGSRQRLSLSGLEKSKREAPLFVASFFWFCVIY